VKIDNKKRGSDPCMENLRKKNETGIQNTMEGHSCRLKQAEDRISELEDEMEIKGKTGELLLTKLTDSIKRPNLRITSIEEREEVQAKGICNIFNKIITENFPHLEKTIPIQVQEASRTPNRFDQKRT
jgi:hypothetical protein